MTLKQLSYYLRVFEFKNITRASESLHIAQPALSKQISQLEEELDTQLFVRGARWLEPTHEGVLLYRHAQTILRQVDRVRAVLGKSDDAITGTVSVGLASSTARMVALPLIQLAKKEIPGVALEIVDIPSADLTKLVVQGRVDFSLSPYQDSVNGIEVTPFLTEELYLLTHPQIDFQSESISVSQLGDLPLILASPPNYIRELVDRTFLSSHATYDLFAEASTSAIALPVVQKGLAATVLPYSSAREQILNGTIRRYSFEPSLFRGLSLCMNESVAQDPAVREVALLITRIIESYFSQEPWPTDYVKDAKNIIGHANTR